MFIVGSSKGSFKNKVELYEENQWIELENYPFSPWISDYGIISTDSSVFIFGGYTGSSEESNIVEYNENGWSEVTQMKDARRGHSAIQISDRVIIVGGKNTRFVKKIIVSQSRTGPNLSYNSETQNYGWSKTKLQSVDIPETILKTTIYSLNCFLCQTTSAHKK